MKVQPPLWNEAATVVEHRTAPTGAGLKRRLCSTSPQHPHHTQILVAIRPVNTHRHDLEICTLLISCRLKARMPVEGRRNLSAIDQRHDKFGRCELDRARAHVTNINLQSAHSTRGPVS